MYLFSTYHSNATALETVPSHFLPLSVSIDLHRYSEDVVANNYPAKAIPQRVQRAAHMLHTTRHATRHRVAHPAHIRGKFFFGLRMLSTRPLLLLHILTTKTHGALVSRSLDGALVILVDPPTPEGQRLIAELGGNTNFAVLDIGWVNKCLEMRRCVGPADNWGGHRLPYTDVNDFFSSGSSTPSTQPPRQHQHPHPPRAPSLHPHALPVFQHDHDMERELYTRAAVAAPPRPIAFQPGIRARYPIPSEPTRRASLDSHLADGHFDSGGPGPSSSSVARSAQARGAAQIRRPHQQPSSTHVGAPHAATSPEVEPMAPSTSQIVMHNNGMGARFTDAEALFMRAYFRWSVKHHSVRTNRQVVNCLHAKVSSPLNSRLAGPIVD